MWRMFLIKGIFDCTQKAYSCDMCDKSNEMGANLGMHD